MPTDREREYYQMGFQDGLKASKSWGYGELSSVPRMPSNNPTKKRKLSAWNKFVKANSKKPRFIMRSGKLNLKKLGVAFRKTPAGRKRKR